MGPKRAFTLVELIVVVAVIAVLAALLAPVLFAGKARALRIQCVNNLHELGTALQVVLETNHGYPVEATSTIGGPALGGEPWFTWADKLERDGLDVVKPEKGWFQKGVWLCPSAQWSSKVNVQTANYYGYNLWGISSPSVPEITHDFGLRGHINSDLQTLTPIQESEVAVPADMMAIGDSFDGSAEFDRKKLGEGTPAEDLLTYGNTLSRHQRKANVVFCDGHVGSPTLTFLFADTNDAALGHWNRDNQPHRENL